MDPPTNDYLQGAQLSTPLAAVPFPRRNVAFCPPPPSIRRSLSCTPVTHPAMPMTHQHPLWQFWDFAVEQQLGRLVSATRMGPGKTPGKPGKAAKPGKAKAPKAPGLLVRAFLVVLASACGCY